MSDWASPKTDYTSASQPDPAELNVVGNNQLKINDFRKTAVITSRAFSNEFSPDETALVFDSRLYIPPGYYYKLKRLYAILPNTAPQSFKWAFIFRGSIDNVFSPDDINLLQYNADDLSEIALGFTNLSNPSSATEDRETLLEVYLSYTELTGDSVTLNKVDIELVFQLLPNGTL